MENSFFVPLHERFDLIQKCCDTLNREWPRSNTARLFSLEKSCDQLPCSLILIEKIGNEDSVVGHSRLSPIRGHKNTCLLESVIIVKEKRGKGLGKLIMEKTEDYARKLKIDTIYLSTHDKQDFYKHLNYDYCEPLNLYGSTINLPAKIESSAIKASVSTQNAINKPEIPPPPALPSPSKVIRKAAPVKWMKKHL